LAIENPTNNAEAIEIRIICAIISSSKKMVNYMSSDLIFNLEKLKTTELGSVRIKRNLELPDVDVVEWCRDKISNSSNIKRQGKNWYVHANEAIITVNAHSYTIITAHKVKEI